MRMYRAALMAGLLVMLPCALSACADDEIKRPDVTAPLMPELGQRGCKNIRTTNYHTLPSFRNISILSRLLVT